MKVNIQSIKFDADKGLIEFIEKKLKKIEQKFDNIVGFEVVLRIDNVPIDNKKAYIRVEIPGNDLFAERTCNTFEEAIDQCVDVLKIQMEKAKAKLRDRK